VDDRVGVGLEKRKKGKHKTKKDCDHLPARRGRSDSNGEKGQEVEFYHISEASKWVSPSKSNAGLGRVKAPAGKNGKRGGRAGGQKGFHAEAIMKTRN